MKSLLNKKSKKPLTIEEMEDILAARLARIFVDQILDNKKEKNPGFLTKLPRKL